MRPVMILRHEFVEHFPDDVREGTIYVSIPYATAVHRCCCGCGREVVTPLSPTDWTLIFDGESVSLHPSVGNWSFPCRSHYWIRRGAAEWAPRWSRGEIEVGRARDAAAKAIQDDHGAGPSLPTASDGAAATQGRERALPWWRRVVRRLSR